MKIRYSAQIYLCALIIIFSCSAQGSISIYFSPKSQFIQSKSQDMNSNESRKISYGAEYTFLESKRDKPSFFYNTGIAYLRMNLKPATNFQSSLIEDISITSRIGLNGDNVNIGFAIFLLGGVDYIKLSHVQNGSTFGSSFGFGFNMLVTKAKDFGWLCEIKESNFSIAGSSYKTSLIYVGFSFFY